MPSSSSVYKQVEKMINNMHGHYQFKQQAIIIIIESDIQFDLPTLPSFQGVGKSNQNTCTHTHTK